MSMKTSEMIFQRRDQAKDLSAGVEACIDDIASGYDDYLSQALGESETPVDTRQQLELVRRSIHIELEGLEGLDDKVVEQFHDNTKGSQSIGTVAGKVTTKMRYVRHSCRAFGPEGMKLADVKDEFPGGAQRIYERADRMQKNLRNPDLGLKPKIEKDGLVLVDFAPDPLKLADALEPEKTQLGDLLDERYLNKRQDVDVRSLRREGIKQFDKNMRALVRIIQGTLVLAGRDDLVDRFSPALRRFTRRPALADDGVGSSPEPNDSAEPSTSDPANSAES